MDYLDFIIAVDNAKEAIYQIDSFIRILKETLDKDTCDRESIIFFGEGKENFFVESLGFLLKGQ